MSTASTCTTRCSTPSGPCDGLSTIATLASATPKKAIGAWSDPAAGGYKCYRYVVVNHGDAALPLTITTVAVKIDSLSPSGGYTVSVNGIGFGKQQGLGGVTVGGFPMAPTAWSDTAITFTMPNMGTPPPGPGTSRSPPTRAPRARSSRSRSALSGADRASQG